METRVDVVYPIKDPDDPVLKGLREKLLAESHRTAQAELEAMNYIRIPLFGRLRCVQDRTGILLMLSIVIYWIYGIWSSYYVIIQPHYQDGRIHLGFLYYHFIIALLCLVALVRASTMNPGRVPEIDTNFAEQNDWRMCPHCGKWRPARTHHCRRCEQCVVRMDHHCPWINNCVGEANHHVFTLLLLYAFLFSLNTFIALMFHFWYWPKCETCDQEALLVKHGIWFCYLSFVMSLMMGIFMLLQLTQHHFNLLINRTTLENMKISSIDDVDITTLHIRTGYNAYREHCGTGKMYLWPWPCRRRKSTLGTRMIYA